MGRRLAAIVSYILLMGCFTALRAEQVSYTVQCFDVDDGMSQNMVYCILQDSKGFMWIGTQDGLNRFDGHEFKIFMKDDDSGNSIGNNNCFSLLESPDGKIWLGTFDGIDIYDPSLELFSHFRTTTAEGFAVKGLTRQMKLGVDGDVWIAGDDGNVFKYSASGELKIFPCRKNRDMEFLTVRAVEPDVWGNAWVATYGLGIMYLDSTSGEIRVFSIPDVGRTDVNAILLLDENTLLVGTTNKGVLYFDIATSSFSSLLETDDSGKPLFVRQIIRDRSGLVWIGTESGIYVYDSEKKDGVWLKHTNGNPYSLSDNAVHALYEDKDGGIWAGTYFGGVNYVTRSSKFKNYYPIVGENSISGKCISEFCQDIYGNIWIGTEDAGLNMFNPKTGTFRLSSLPSRNIHALLSDGNYLWAGTFGDGLFRIDVKTGKVDRNWRIGDMEGTQLSNNVYALFKDVMGTIWVGTTGGLYKYNPDSDRFSAELPGLSSVHVSDIMQDIKGDLWVTTVGKGVFSYNFGINSSLHHDLINFPQNVVEYMTCIVEDTRGRIWVGMDGFGLIMYDSYAGGFISRFTEKNGLPNNVVYSLVCDKYGDVWGSTNKGIFRINTESMSITSYNKDNGLLCDQFNYRSGFMDNEGTIYFGGIKGFVSFRPEKLNAWSNASAVLINRLIVNNAEVRPGDKSMPLLSRSIMETDEVEIPHTITAFSLGLSEINYDSVHKNRYFYKLEGWDKDWTSIDMPNTVTYSNISYGNYVFKLRADRTDSDDIIAVKIDMKPPFYLTVWAYLFYVVMAAVLAFVLVRTVQSRLKEKEKYRMKELEAEKEKEVYAAKIDFFSNITHEIRTPLTLIKIPLEEVIKTTPRDNENYNNLLIMRDNSDRLLSLTNQLLNFRKSNSGEQQPLFVHTDVSKIVRNVITRFMPSIKLKKAELELSVPDALSADVDIEMFVKMVSNLMTNALKHAKTLIGVDLTVGKDSFTFGVTNDGDVIAPEDADRIFNLFFKGEDSTEGFGIGLPFTRQLASLHNGDVALVPHRENLTRFEITLPLVQKSILWIKSEDLTYNTPAKVKSETELPQKKTVMLVDNDQTFLNFIAGQIEYKYNVIRAVSAREALSIIEKSYVDAVISDIVMPQMTGIELCRYLKGDVRYKSIPVILLTNEVNLQTKIEGLQAGAEIYIEKPFYVDYLISCIENIFKSEYIQDEPKNTSDITENNIGYTKADEKFMELMTAAIYENFDDVDLDVNKLASLMNMSRASLYRKVKESLRITPNDFIRVVRLKKAAELLRQKEYRINEIAFIVGFRSSSYFSKCFFKQYGVLPKDFVR